MEKCRKIEEYITNNNIDLIKVVNDYTSYVYKVVENMQLNLFSDEDIEEIVSDTFFILWKNTLKLDKQKNISSYLAGIARNLVKEKARKLDKNVDISEYENILQDSKDIDLLYEERERNIIIENTLSKMEKDDEEIFKLYYYSSTKISDIAKILNCTEFRIKSRLFRIRKKIKKNLEKGGYSYEK